MSPQPSLNPADVDLLIGSMKVVFPTRDELDKIIDEKLIEKIGKLPTKEEFFSRMDKLSKEIQDARDELTLHTGNHNDLQEKDEELDTRVRTVEKKLGISPSSV